MLKKLEKGLSPPDQYTDSQVSQFAHAGTGKSAFRSDQTQAESDHFEHSACVYDLQHVVESLR